MCLGLSFDTCQNERAKSFLSLLLHISSTSNITSHVTLMLLLSMMMIIVVVVVTTTNNIFHDKALTSSNKKSSCNVNARHVLFIKKTKGKIIQYMFRIYIIDILCFYFFKSCVFLFILFFCFTLMIYSFGFIFNNREIR